MKTKRERLEAGETVISCEPGNSMMPILKSRQPVQLSPATWEQVDRGDIVYCKVRGRYYTHKVLGKNAKRGVQIGNNRGHVNGWTKSVFGLVTKILGELPKLKEKPKQNISGEVYREMAKAHPKLSRGLVICTHCGRTVMVDSKACLRRGWPECCGETMSLDVEEVRKRLNEEATAHEETR